MRAMQLRSSWRSTVRQQTFGPALLLWIVAAGNVSFAQSKADITAAKDAFKAGQQFMQMQRFGEAVVEFKKAYAITQDGLVMGQVALAYEKAGDYEAALDAIKVYRKALPKADRASVDPLIRKYKRRIKGGRSRPLVLPETQPQKQPPGVEPLPEEATPPAKVQPNRKVKAPVEVSKPRKGRFWTWIAAGTAGALAVSALVVGLSAQSKFDELNDRCGPDAGGVCAPGDVDSVKTRALVSDVLWGTAAAAAITSGVLFFVEGHGAAESASSDADTKEKMEENTGDDEDKGSEEEEEDDDYVRRIQVAPFAGGGSIGLGAVFRY